MAGLDTNVLLRWLVRDDDIQAGKADSLLESAKARKERYFIPVTVALELEWVLRSRYCYARGTFAQTLADLLETRELEFQSEEALEAALGNFVESNADFADCLHSGLCAEGLRSPLLTFDSRAARLADARLL